MKTATILILVALLVALALFGFGACQVESPGVSLSWQNDSQAQETARLRIQETERTERTRINAEYQWQGLMTLVIITGMMIAGVCVLVLGYNLARRPVAPRVTVNVFAPPPQVAGWLAPPPQVAGWLAQNPEWYFDGEMLVNPPPPQVAGWLAQNPEWYFDGEMLVNPARRKLMDVSSIPTTRRLTG